MKDKHKDGGNREVGVSVTGDNPTFWGFRCHCWLMENDTECTESNSKEF